MYVHGLRVVVRLLYMYNVFNNRHFDGTGDAVNIYAVCDARLKVRWICWS
jgi:hypothetical protein